MAFFGTKFSFIADGVKHELPVPDSPEKVTKGFEIVKGKDTYSVVFVATKKTNADD